MKNNKFVLSDLLKMSIFAGVSYILMFFAFPIIPVVPYLKIDFSDVPILIGSLIFGPLGGIIIAAIKSILYWITTGPSVPNLIGVFSSFVSSVTLVESLYLGRKLFRKQNGFKKTFNIIFLMTFLLILTMSILNWLVVTPLYISLIGLKIGFSIPTLVLIGIVPFNFIKGILIGIIFVFVKNKFLPRIKNI